MPVLPEKMATFTGLIIFAFMIHSPEQSPSPFVPHINKFNVEQRWQLTHIQNNSAFEDC